MKMRTPSRKKLGETVISVNADVNVIETKKQVSSSTTTERPSGNHE